MGGSMERDFYAVLLVSLLICKHLNYPISIQLNFS